MDRAGSILCCNPQVDLEVLERHDQAIEHALLGRIHVGFSYILRHTQLSNMTFLLSETLRVVREIRQDEHGTDCYQHSNGTLDFFFFAD